MEEWKDVKGYEGYYQVSNTGQVRSVERTVTNSRSRRCKPFDRVIKSQILRQYKRPKEPGYYLFVVLQKDHKRNYVCVHRLVAEAFIPNDNKKPFINHIDGDKSNNNVGNLEWVTQRENVDHAIKAGLSNPGAYRKKKVIRSDGKIFESVTEAAKSSGSCVADVSKCCLGKRKSTNGYSFKYEEEK